MKTRKENELERGEEAKKTHSQCHSNERLVYIRYKDHVLFINADSLLLGPSVREAIGWVKYETGEEVHVCIDRAYKALPYEDPMRDSGLVILKSTILEMFEVEEKWKS